MCTVASAPKPKRLVFSLACTKSEIRSRSPDAATVACLTVTATPPEPSSGKVFPANCASTTLLISVKGRSIGTPMLHPPGVGGTMVIFSGKGQSGLVCIGVIRVSALIPTVSVTAEASTRGCAAIACVGLISSHSGGIAAVVPVSCKGIERQALAHCRRALCSSVGSLRIFALTASSCSLTALSMKGLTCAGTLTCAPDSERLVSPSETCAPKFGSTCQAAATLGRAVTVTLPLISALALSALMLTLPICLAALAPSKLPMASVTAPVAFDDNEPVTFSLPVSGVDSDSTSSPPLAVIGPREAVQPMSAFCRSCDTGLSALPLKLVCALRSAASRIADSAIETGATTKELREAGGSGGGSVMTGAWIAPPGDSQSIAFRLTRKEIATTPSAIPTVLSRLSRCILPPDEASRRVYRAARGRTGQRTG